jgi:hypothetical protein
VSAEKLLTHTQHRFAEAVRACLNAAHVAFSEKIEGSKDESWYLFQIHPAADGLAVSVAIVDDQFDFSANDAWFFIARTAWVPDDVEGWIAESISYLGALLRNELRIRVTRRLFGGKAGAVWVSGIPGIAGAWNGDLSAVQGAGTEQTFAWPWYRLSDAP